MFAPLVHYDHDGVSGIRWQSNPCVYRKITPTRRVVAAAKAVGGSSGGTKSGGNGRGRFYVIVDTIKMQRPRHLAEDMCRAIDECARIACGKVGRRCAAGFVKRIPRYHRGVWRSAHWIGASVVGASSVGLAFASGVGRLECRLLFARVSEEMNWANKSMQTPVKQSVVISREYFIVDLLSGHGDESSSLKFVGKWKIHSRLLFLSFKRHSSLPANARRSEGN